MHVRLAVGLGLLTATTIEAQSRTSSAYSPIPVRSCPYADSLLGPAADDVRGAVRGSYDDARDTSYFLTGVGAAKPPDITSSTKFAGREQVRAPTIQVTAFLRGRDAQNVTEESRNGPVNVVFILDDSVTVYPASTTLGRVQGDGAAMTLPASARLAGKELLAVARARRIVMKTGAASFLLTDERRELRALIRVAVCPR